MPHYKEGNARASQFDLARYYHFLYEKYKKEDFKVGLNFYLGKACEENIFKSLLQSTMPQMFWTDYMTETIGHHDFPETEIFSKFHFRFTNALPQDSRQISHLAGLGVLTRGSIILSGPMKGLGPPLEMVKKIHLETSGHSRTAVYAGFSLDSIKSYMDIGVKDFIISSEVYDELMERVEDKREIFNSKNITKLANIVTNY